MHTHLSIHMDTDFFSRLTVNSEINVPMYLCTWQDEKATLTTNCHFTLNLSHTPKHTISIDLTFSTCSQWQLLKQWTQKEIALSKLSNSPSNHTDHSIQVVDKTAGTTDCGPPSKNTTTAVSPTGAVSPAQCHPHTDRPSDDHHRHFMNNILYGRFMTADCFLDSVQWLAANHMSSLSQSEHHN